MNDLNKSKNAVVLLSGGVDSTTVLSIADTDGYDLYALTFDYKQRHRIELDMARSSAEMLNVKQHLLLSVDLGKIGGSALTADIEVPKNGIEAQKYGSTEETDNSTIPVTYVPARNTIFLSLALAWAEVIGAEDIFIGVNAVDYSGYPDCRPEFLKAFEDMANLATKASVEGTLRYRIHAPLINMSKAEIIRKGVELGVDHSHTWSCYDPQLKNDKYLPCTKCDSCLLRSKGFKEAGVNDTAAEL